MDDEFTEPQSRYKGACQTFDQHMAGTRLPVADRTPSPGFVQNLYPPIPPSWDLPFKFRGMESPSPQLHASPTPTLPPSQASSQPALPSCRTCKKPMKEATDKQKTRPSFWKNCKECREKRNVQKKQKMKERRERGLVAEEGQTIRQLEEHMERELEQVRASFRSDGHVQGSTTAQALSNFERPSQESRVAKKARYTSAEKIDTGAAAMLNSDDVDDALSSVDGQKRSKPEVRSSLLFSRPHLEFEGLKNKKRKRCRHGLSESSRQYLGYHSSSDDEIGPHYFDDLLSPNGVRKRSSNSETRLGYISDEQLDTHEAENIQEPKTQDRGCAVCTDTFPREDFPSLISCTHEPDICRGCLLTWLEQGMASTTWEQIKCASHGCDSFITHLDVRTLASAEVFTRFDELSMRSFLSDDPNFFHCSAEGCISGQIHSNTDANIFVCNACGFRVCTHHTPHVPFHDDETCAEYNDRIALERAQREDEQRRLEQEEASQAEVARSAVACPGCGAYIQKTEGCDHMTCGRKGCGFQFCYVCRAPYAGANGIWRAGNSAHTTECRYHPAKLPVYNANLIVLDGA